MTHKQDRITVIDGQVFLYPQFISRRQANRYFALLYEQILWQKETLFLYGRNVDVPRLTAWYGDKQVNYRYSGVDHVALPWNQTLLEIRSAICCCVSEAFNAVLLNLYRHGADSMGWHSDDEKELGDLPVIASVSFGQERRIQFRRKNDHKDRINLTLPHGSLLLMQGKSQQQWQHQVPKSRKLMQARINLTFRNIFTP